MRRISIGLVGDLDDIESIRSTWAVQSLMPIVANAAILLAIGDDEDVLAQLTIGRRAVRATSTTICSVRLVKCGRRFGATLPPGRPGGWAHERAN